MRYSATRLFAENTSCIGPPTCGAWSTWSPRAPRHWLCPPPLASRLQVPASTVKRYLNLLDLLFITRRTPASSTSLTTRAAATPELVLTGSGLAAHLTGNARGGRGAAEHLIGALRCMHGYLVADGILTQAENPAARAAKPRRLRSARMALPDSRLDELCRVASTTGNDPALDALLLRLHMETACRRGGALALAPDDLDPVPAPHGLRQVRLLHPEELVEGPVARGEGHGAGRVAEKPVCPGQALRACQELSSWRSCLRPGPGSG